jgi:hypothetical protein
MVKLMKNMHIAALACFAVAGLLYYIAATSALAPALVVLGGIFEIAGWANLFKRRENEID